MKPPTSLFLFRMSTSASGCFWASASMIRSRLVGLESCAPRSSSVLHSARSPSWSWHRAVMSVGDNASQERRSRRRRLRAGNSARWFSYAPNPGKRPGSTSSIREYNSYEWSCIGVAVRSRRPGVSSLSSSASRYACVSLGVLPWSHRRTRWASSKTTDPVGLDDCIDPTPV